MRHSSWHICLLFLLLPCLTLFTACHERAPVSAVPVTEAIETNENGETYIRYNVNIPLGGTIEGWREHHGKPGEKTKMAVEAKPAAGYRFVRWSDGNTDAKRHDSYANHDLLLTAQFAVDRAELPIFRIETETGGDVTTKTEYMSADVWLFNTGNADWELSRTKAEIRGRGNGTWTFEKKAYRLKFEQAQQLLGLGTGKSRSWILMANYNDRTLMRNYLAIWLANRLDGIGFNSSSTPVEVYLNGEYHGVYLLAEQIQEGDCRVDLGWETMTEEQLAAPDAGFLVEMDDYAEGDYRFVVGDRPFEVKSEVQNDAQFAYIKQYIKDVHDAIMSGEREKIEALVDLDSVLDGYVLEEFFKNIDVGWSSFYMYKRAGEVMHFGPFWDFDLSSGNDSRLENGTYENLYVGVNSDMSQRHRWYIRLCREPWFTELAIARFYEIQPLIDEMLEEARRFQHSAPTAFNRNFERWRILGTRANMEPEEILSILTYDENVDWLVNWFESRRNWMLDLYASENPYQIK